MNTRLLFVTDICEQNNCCGSRIWRYPLHAFGYFW